MTWSARYAAVWAIRLLVHDGQTPRPLQENAKHYLLFAVLVLVLQYEILAWFAYLLHPNHKTMRSPRQYLRLPVSDYDNSLRICATTYVGFYVCWRIIWIILLHPWGYADVWHSPEFRVFTLAGIEHAVSGWFSLALIVDFLANSYGGTAFSKQACIHTAALLTLFHATHLAIP